MASDAFGLNTLTTLRPNVVPRDVVVIHGLYGSHHSNWTDVNRKYVTFRLSLYTYNVFGSNGGVLTRSGARDEATKLLDSLVKLRGNDSETANIVFIAHDIGGSLVKEVGSPTRPDVRSPKVALLTPLCKAVVLSQQRKYQDIYRSISLLAFFGCPHRGLKPDLQSGCTEILMSHERTTFAEAWELAGPLVEWALEASDSFAETRLSTMVEMINVASSHSDSKQMVKYGKHSSIVLTGSRANPPAYLQVFGQFEASLLIGSQMQQNVVFLSKLAHKDLLGGRNPDLRGEILMRDNPFANGKISPHVHSFLSQTAPQYTFETHFSTNNRPELATVRAGFEDLMSSAGPGLHLVHVSGAPGYSAAEVAEHLFKWTDARGNAFGGSTAFFFDPTDCRYDSAEAMLCTLLTQYCSNKPFWQHVEQIVKPLDISRDWQVEDLYAAAADFVLQFLAAGREESVKEEVTHTVILGNLDGRIRNGSWLVRKLQETIAGCDLRFKIIVTSSDPASLAAEWASTSTYGPLQGSQSVPFASSVSGEESIISDNPERKAIGQENGGAEGEQGSGDQDESALSMLKGVLAIVQKQPQLYSCIAALRQLAQSCGSDTKLWRMISDWLKDGQLPQEDQLHGFISQLIPATPSKVFKSILTSVPPQARSWTASLLERVVFAFRPLTLSELLDLERLGWPKESPDGLPRSCTMEELRDRLRGGLLIIRRQEVHLAHPDLRDYLLLASKDNALGGWLPLDSEGSMHGRIAVSCLQYLTCPEKRQLMRHRASESGSWHTPFERRDDFLSYAVKYWLRHAKCD
ncbi:hypothetical protein QBC46DRAFT_356574 [Diplogelasinospora grovesii]|uniref:DUF676 domain-containing protein n=1 Tax=Diplogelasinospora grovesii TaxID=303347 RepID=A0AAN6N2G5_9PEZI|nr:hypothetical protein QBC46DRAFT_356574 [Diplogelasinospora grovesii]